LGSDTASSTDWRGFADFVERQPDGRYEVVDTKLARHSKPAYVLQPCFYFDRWWNPAVEQQATDRVYRLGRRKPVFVHSDADGRRALREAQSRLVIVGDREGRVSERGRDGDEPDTVARNLRERLMVMPEVPTQARGLVEDASMLPAWMAASITKRRTGAARTCTLTRF